MKTLTQKSLLMSITMIASLLSACNKNDTRQGNFTPRGANSPESNISKTNSEQTANQSTTNYSHPNQIAMADRALETYVPIDPLFKHLWHLRNSGQNNFAKNSGIAGNDIHLTDWLALNYTGKGVKALVSDDGFESTHEDLKDNVIPLCSDSDSNLRKDCSINYRPSDQHSQYSPDPITDKDNHGTAVAGLIAAGSNVLGSRGIAPATKMASRNFLSSARTLPQYLEQVSGDFDIFNHSWGQLHVDALTPIDPLYNKALKNGISTGRNGNGSIYVKAAGEDFFRLVPKLDGIIRTGEAVFEGDTTTPYSILVGSINAKGVASSYSSLGSNIWISAPGGEFGDDDPAIMTTDRSGCIKGYSTLSNNINPFEKGHGENLNCNYTSTMNGTSSAAPIVSGVIALMLEANPNLTWRDVKHILAKTAKQIDKDSSQLNQYPIQLQGKTLIRTDTQTKFFECHGCDVSPNLPMHMIWDEGWIQNDAQLHFNNKYGFGLIDAETAVKMAKDYPNQNGNPLGEFVETKNQSINCEVNLTSCWIYSDKTKIPLDYYNASNEVNPQIKGDGFKSKSIRVKENYVIEAVQIQLQVTHPNLGQLSIKLISPAGTISTITHMGNALEDLPSNSSVEEKDYIGSHIFLSNAFYGENSQGDWTLQLIDGEMRKSLGYEPRSLDSWKINIIGHKK